MVFPKHPINKGLQFSAEKLAGPAKKNVGGHPLAPMMRAQTVLGKGPAYLAKANKPERGSGPGEPPPGFVTPTTSAVEWNVYWAVAKVLKFPENPREGPFFGDHLFWGYQIGLDGGRSSGGAVIDFLIYANGSRDRFGIRVVTQYFHLGQGSGKIAQDETQKANLEKYVSVYDLYDSEVVNDLTGEKSVIAVKKAMQLIPSLDPVFGGTALPNRSVG